MREGCVIRSNELLLLLERYRYLGCNGYNVSMRFFFEIYKYEFNVCGAGHPATTVRLVRTITGQPPWRGHLLLTTWVRAE